MKTFTQKNNPVHATSRLLPQSFDQLIPTPNLCAMYSNVRCLFLLCCVGLWIAPSHAQEQNQTFTEIGRTIERTGEELARTIDYYTQGIRYHPQHAPSYNNRAAVYFERGDFRQAILDYTQALRYYRHDDRDRLARVHYKRGLCFYILGEYQEAIEDFSAAITYRPDISDSYYFRGKIKVLIFGDSYTGEADLQQVIQNAQRPSIQVAFAYYLLGNLNYAGIETKRILAKTRQKNHQQYATMCYNIAGLQALIGNRYEAIRYLRTSLDYGYNQWEWLRRDINFKSLVGDPEFEGLLREHRVQYVFSGSQDPYQQNETPTQTRGGIPAVISSRDLRFEDGNGNGQLDPNETGFVVFELTNISNRTLVNVRALMSETSGAYGLRYEQEFLLGDLGRGGRRQVRFEVRGTDYLRPGQADFEVNVLTGIIPGFGTESGPLSISLPTRTSNPPSLDVVDFRFSSEAGGIFRTGQPITLKVAVQNTGAGTAQDVRISCEFPNEVFPTSEKVIPVGDLPPGSSQTVDFEFFASSRFTNPTLPIVVEVTDAAQRYQKRRTLTINLDAPLEREEEVVIAPNPPAPTNPASIQLISDVDTDLPRTRNQNKDAVAVVIGNRDYLNRDVPTVDYALHDALVMKKYLTEVYGFDENNILYLNNATQADFNGIFGTKEDHRARLYNLVKPGQSDVFVFYSGHGAPDLETEAAYFVPVNCDPSLVKFNGYAINTLYENLAKIPYRNLTVVIDACFSGSSDKGTLIPRASIVRIKPQQNSILQDPNAMVFTSASGSQIASWYPEQAHGLFTYYFLKGLQGAANANKDRTLTLGEMETYLQEEVPYMARRLNNRVQTPTIYGRAEKGLLTY